MFELLDIHKKCMNNTKKLSKRESICKALPLCRELVEECSRLGLFSAPIHVPLEIFGASRREPFASWHELFGCEALSILDRVLV